MMFVEFLYALSLWQRILGTSSKILKRREAVQRTNFEERSAGLQRNCFGGNNTIK